MAIINTTADSFYGSSRVSSVEAAALKAAKFEKEGADILDIGGESTRPGSLPIPPEVEIERTIPTIIAVKAATTSKISIDTTKAIVAEKAIEAGATIVNDISAMSFDKKMVGVVKAHGSMVVLTHIKGTPLTMQNAPHYDNVVNEVTEWLLNRANYAEKNGILPEKIILDPGIGFGKMLNDNLQLISKFTAAVDGRYPVLIGHSRKKFIGELLSRENPDDRLFGTIGASIAASLCGASILRVHDPAPTIEALVVACTILSTISTKGAFKEAV